jgi:hypothetical protein
MLPTITHPITTCTLPDSKIAVKYRPFLRGEEKVLLIAKESENEDDIESAIYQVIEQCTSGQIRRETRLSSIDLEFLFLKLRIASKGQTTKVGLKCRAHVEREELVHPIHGKIPAYSGACNKINEITIDLEDVFAHIPKKSDCNIKLGGGIGITMRYPDAAIMKRHKALANESDVMAIVYDCIDSIFDADNVYSVDDLDDKKLELDAFFDQFNDTQSKKIVEFFNNMPQLKLKVKFKCQSCGHEEEIELKGIQDFF